MQGNLRFEVIDSKITTDLDSSSRYTHLDSIKEYLTQSAEWPKLIYGDEEVKAELDQLSIKY